MAPGTTDYRTDWTLERAFYPALTHYYGDIVRQLMLGAVVLMLAGAPFYSDSLQNQFAFEIVAAIVVVTFAALTNPYKNWVVIMDAAITGAGAAIFGSWALASYGEVDAVAFVLRVAIALLFMFGFYFSLKTLRAMLLHQIGKPDSSSPKGNSSDPLAEEKTTIENITRNVRGD